ncbi:MAG TPA: HlyD family efflux transporter periplasmic adaptor subunit, partial [Paludibacter sp.]|nr:HlyD family efflux transporter periplasmic adaptor subunit [Paludibacter sp.]
SNQGITDESEGLTFQIKQLEDQLDKCKITSPIDGTVLVKYAEMGEVAAPGKALFKIADTNNMILRAYITADQLTKIKVGQTVKVKTDSGKDGSKEYSGTIAWISSKAEFTPKTIQTRDERANLVYAVKINVKNDGLIKIGMYGDAQFN